MNPPAADDLAADQPCACERLELILGAVVAVAVVLVGAAWLLTSRRSS